MEILSENLSVSRTLGLVALSLLLCTFIYNWFKCRKYPPGPMGLPIIGYTFFLGKKPNLTLMDIGKKYNGLFRIYIGPQINICVSEYHMIKEILKHPMTLSRPPHSFDILAGKGGFGGMSGEDWREQRRYTMQSMKNLGLGKGLWEKMIQGDAAEFAKAMAKAKGHPIQFYDTLSVNHIINSLSLMFGRSLNKIAEKDDIEIIKCFGKAVTEQLSPVDINVNVPWLNKLLQFFNVKGFQDFLSLLKKFENILLNEINKRLPLTKDSVRDDFIGSYLSEMEKKEREPNTTYSVENLMGNIFILVLAGHHSTVASLCWLFLLMAKNQKAQKKVCDEIDQVIGRDGTIAFEDRNQMPYTMACIMEMNRWSAITALFPPRYVLESFNFNGYEIPKGAHIICNAWAMMHDPKHFENPEEYRPERFLTNEGEVKYTNVDGYGPFSFGKRNCPGESVAIMSLFLYFVTIMQKFKLRTPGGAPPNLDYKFASGLMPYPQKLCFIER